MDKFEDVVQKHKNSTTEALIRFGEGKRVNKAMADIESNRMYFHYFYEAGQKSRQAELDQAYEDIETFVQAHQRECDIKVQIANELKEKDKRINQALNFINNWWHPDLDQKLFVEALGRALRGEHEA